MSTRKTDEHVYNKVDNDVYKGREFDEKAARAESYYIAEDLIKEYEKKTDVTTARRLGISYQDGYMDGAHAQFNTHKAALDRLDEAEKLITGAEEVLSHAIELGHLGEGSTHGWAADTLELIAKWKGST